MKPELDYYQILHVHPDAPREIIKSSYRTLMQRMRMHPDLGGDNDSAAIINEAYAVLMEPEQREAYDKSRLAQAANDGVVNEQPEPDRESDRPQWSQEQPGSDCAFCGTPFPSRADHQAQAFCPSCDSPRHMAGQLQEEGTDRRAILRVQKSGTVDFYTQWPARERHQGGIEDLSLTGMRFCSRVELQAGQVLKVEAPVLRGIARVTRVSPQATGWEVGVQFLSLHFERSRGAFIADCV